MNRHLITILKFALFLGFGLLLLWLIIRNYSAEQWAEIGESFRNAKYIWLVISLVFGILSHISRAARWRMLITPLGVTPRLSVTFCAVMVGYLANLAFPRLGEVTKCGIINKYERIPADKLVGTMLVERSIDLLSLIIVTVLALVFQFNLISDFFNEKVLSVLIEKFSLGLQSYLILALFLLVFVGVLLLIVRMIRGSAFYKKIRLLMQNVKTGLGTIKEVSNLPVFIFHSVFIWFMYFMMVFISFYAISETSQLGLSAGLAILVFGSVGIIATPGGIGAYQLIVTETLVRLYLLAESIAFAFSNMLWAGQTVMILVMGTACVLILPIINEKRMTYEPSGHPAE